MTLDRRTALKSFAASGLLAPFAPAIAFANADTERRLLFVFLRGGMDGLSAVPPYGDPGLLALREPLTYPKPDSGQAHAMHKLDGLFGLNPELRSLHALYGRGEMLAVHAMASPYRERSHFDAQDVMENGASDKGMRVGWLNRALSVMPRELAKGRSDVALGIGATLPLSLRGPAAVGGWSPPTLPAADQDTLARIGDLYKDYPVLATALAKAQSAGAMASGMDDMGMGKDQQGTGGTLFFTEMTKVAAEFLKAADGPRICVMDLGNWDSHAGQNDRIEAADDKFQGRFVELYKALDRGVEIVRLGLGPEIWRKTAVVAVTEFGRTVRVNGTLGSDHGTGGAMFLAGGAVAGGRVLADWPGLRERDLHEGRDLRPTTDVRSVFKAVLRDHFAVAEAALEEAVFPDSRAAAPTEGLIRA